MKQKRGLDSISYGRDSDNKEACFNIGMKGRVLPRVDRRRLLIKDTDIK